ncbi:hypothetical protein C0J52_27436 [Blattella germanica]|nr:hypothetical protein C0J52_27436 [Blattella germanica]
MLNPIESAWSCLKAAVKRNLCMQLPQILACEDRALATLRPLDSSPDSPVSSPLCGEADTPSSHGFDVCDVGSTCKVRMRKEDVSPSLLHTDISYIMPYHF